MSFFKYFLFFNKSQIFLEYLVNVVLVKLILK